MTRSAPRASDLEHATDRALRHRSSVWFGILGHVGHGRVFQRNTDAHDYSGSVTWYAAPQCEGGARPNRCHIAEKGWVDDALSALTRPASPAVSRATGFWGSPECAGKRLPDCSDRSGYSLIRHGGPTESHSQDAPPRGVFHTGSFDGNLEKRMAKCEADSTREGLLSRRRAAGRAAPTTGR
jgi:hypothetical protein